jgi:F-type H+-transporting ATPase subunit b
MLVGVAYAAEEGGSAISVVPVLADIWPSIVAFAILFLLLKKFAFGPISACSTSAPRRSGVAREGRGDPVEAERLLEEYKEQMAEARAEAGKVIDQGRKVAESMKEEIVAKANEEAEQIVVKAREAIEAEKRAAMVELQGSVADLSVAVAGKLIGEKLSPPSTRRSSSVRLPRWEASMTTSEIARTYARVLFDLASAADAVDAADEGVLARRGSGTRSCRPAQRADRRRSPGGEEAGCAARYLRRERLPRSSRS